MLNKIASHWPWLLAGVALLAAIIVIYLIVVLRRSRAEEGAQDEENSAPDPATSSDSIAEAEAGTAANLGLQATFHEQIRRLKSYVSGSNYRYQLPWFLMLGAKGSRAPELLAQAGLNFPFGEPELDLFHRDVRCDFWFFDRGILLDVGGDFVPSGPERGRQDKSWNQLLRLLQRHRPAKPMEGVVLAISCRELLEARRRGLDGTEELGKRATDLYRTLWQTQKQLGIRFPVYILVTDADQLAGFGQFAQALPERLRHQIFGWSSPYNIDAGYRASWVDEAFGSLGRRLDEAQMEILGERPEAAEVDEVFLFPSELRKLAEPLRVYLDRLFKPSAYHESILLRGLYFCGAEVAPSPADTARANAATASAPEAAFHAAPASSAAVRSGRQLFVKELLEQKVFPEAALATPTAATLLASNRRVLATQITLAATALCLALGVWWARGSLLNSKVGLANFITHTHESLRGIGALGLSSKTPESESGRAQTEIAPDSGEPGGPAPPFAPTGQTDPNARKRRKAAITLLNDLTRIGTSRFDSIFLPSSWFSPFNQEVKGVIEKAYSAIIFKAIHSGLKARAERLTLNGRYPCSPSGASTLSTSTDQVPEFVCLQNFVADLSELEENIDAYKNLQQSRDLRKLDQLVAFALGDHLPDGFLRQAGLYREALSGIDPEPFDFEPYRHGARELLDNQVDSFYLEIFRDGGLVNDLIQVTSGLTSITSAGVQGSERFEKTLDHLANIEVALAQSELEWLFRRGDHFAPGAEFEELVDDVERSLLLGSRSAERIQALGQKLWSQFQSELTDYQAPVTGGALLEFDRAHIGLSDDTRYLKAALESFRGQDFLSLPEAPETFVRDLPQDKRLLWDRTQLERTAGLYEQYQRFRANGFQLLPEALRPTLDSISRQRLASKISDQVFRAQDFGPRPPTGQPLLNEESIRAEIRSFEFAAKPLKELVNHFETLGFEQEAEDLATLVARQGIQLLGNVEALLNAEKLYQTRAGNFDFWDGIGPVGVDAFGAQNAEEMAHYLDLQRDRLNQLAQVYAKPIITWLGTSSEPLADTESTSVPVGDVFFQSDDASGDRTAAKLFLKWRSILLGLYENEAQKPGNPLSRLEQLLFKELPGVRLESCLENTPPASINQSSGNYFVSTGNGLRTRLVSRCVELADERGDREYAQLAKFFTENLAKRYPFSDSLTADEANPDDLRAFFTLFDKSAQIIRSANQDNAWRRESRRETLVQHSQREAIIRFLDRAGEVRAFLKSFLDGEQQARAPIFDVEVEFRINREFEDEGHQIIGWSLEVDGTTIDLREPKKEARWQVGQPIAVSLRWPNQGERFPVPDKGSAARLSDERTITFEYANEWSLVRLLQAHPSSGNDFEQYTDPPRDVLTFIVDTRSEDGFKIKSDDVKVFIRLRVKEPGTTRAVQLPRFPVEAPELITRTAAR